MQVLLLAGAARSACVGMSCDEHETRSCLANCSAIASVDPNALDRSSRERLVRPTRKHDQPMIVSNLQ
eukprot:5593304-Prymnesium_polylepis.1